MGRSGQRRKALGEAQLLEGIPRRAYLEQPTKLVEHRSSNLVAWVGPIELCVWIAILGGCV
eukprot:5507294-Pyramimonas_sp.AAC.1